MPATAQRRKKSNGKDNMGRAATEATIENVRDAWDEEQGRLTPSQVRRVTLSEALDFVIDPIQSKLIGNPAHGGEHVIGLY